MEAFQNLSGEVAENWPALVYIAMMAVFSVFFFRERRAEARQARQIGEAIQDSIGARFDRLESLVVDSTAAHDARNVTERESRAARAGFSS